MSRKIPRRKVLKGIGAASAVGLAGCSGGGGGGGGGGNQLKVGVLMPLTGDLGSLGKPIRDGALLPAKQVAGSDAGVSIKTAVEDTQTNPSAGVGAAESLVNANYNAITGAASSGVSLKVYKEVLIPAGVVGCSPASTSPNITTLKDNNLIFRTAPSDALQGQVMAQVAVNRENASSAATLYVNNDYGQALSNSFAQAFKKKGGSVQKQVAFKKGQSSYSSVLSKALGGDPDILVIVGYPDSGKQIFRDYYAEYSKDRTIMVTDGLKASSLPEDVGQPMNNVIGTAPKSSGPQHEKFVSLYKNQYDRKPGVFNAHAYDATAVLALAQAYAKGKKDASMPGTMQTVANPGGTTVGPKNFPKGLEMAMNGNQVKYVGASSPVDFDKNGDMKAVSYDVWKFSNGKIKTIDTVEFGGS